MRFSTTFGPEVDFVSDCSAQSWQDQSDIDLVWTRKGRPYVCLGLEIEEKGGSIIHMRGPVPLTLANF
jgi:hypothetical protein